jgi:hypothetical protein
MGGPQCIERRLMEQRCCTGRSISMTRIIFKLLLAYVAEVNARANVDVSGSEGFGGPTPIYNAVASHGKHQGSMAGKLLEFGASTTVRASLRKFLDCS